MEGVRIDIRQREVSFHKHGGKEETPRQDSIQGDSSKTCNVCLQRSNKKERESLSTRLIKYLTNKSVLEEKLKRYNVKCDRSRNPLQVFSRFISRLIRGEGGDKFTTAELQTLSLSQLTELKYSLAGAVSAKTAEIHREEDTRGQGNQQLDLLKEEARALEHRAWSTLQPFLNLHPSLDDLTRVLMS